MQAVELATPDVVISHQFSEALERLSCDELEQLCTLYERMGIGLEGAERSADVEANVGPLKAPRVAEEVAADVGEPSAAPPAPVLPSAPATSSAPTVPAVTTPPRKSFHMSAHAAGAARYRQKARMALAGGY